MKEIELDDRLIAVRTHLLFCPYEVDLVTDDHDWYGALRVEYLGSKGLHLEERTGVVDVVNQNEGVG